MRDWRWLLVPCHEWTTCCRPTIAARSGNIGRHDHPSVAGQGAWQTRDKHGEPRAMQKTMCMKQHRGCCCDVVVTALQKDKNNSGCARGLAGANPGWDVGASPVRAQPVLASQKRDRIAPVFENNNNNTLQAAAIIRQCLGSAPACRGLWE